MSKRQGIESHVAKDDNHREGKRQSVHLGTKRSGSAACFDQLGQVSDLFEPNLVISTARVYGVQSDPLKDNSGGLGSPSMQIDLRHSQVF